MVAAKFLKEIIARIYEDTKAGNPQVISYQLSVC
jgi:hypothetical protein